MIDILCESASYSDELATSTRERGLKSSHNSRTFETNALNSTLTRQALIASGFCHGPNEMNCSGWSESWRRGAVPVPWMFVPVHRANASHSAMNACSFPGLAVQIPSV